MIETVFGKPGIGCNTLDIQRKSLKDLVKRGKITREEAIDICVSSHLSWVESEDDLETIKKYHEDFYDSIEIGGIK